MACPRCKTVSWLMKTGHVLVDEPALVIGFGHVLLTDDGVYAKAVARRVCYAVILVPFSSLGTRCAESKSNPRLRRLPLQAHTAPNIHQNPP